MSSKQNKKERRGRLDYAIGGFGHAPIGDAWDAATRLAVVRCPFERILSTW